MEAKSYSSYLNMNSSDKMLFHLPGVEPVAIEQDPSLVFELHGTVTWRCVGNTLPHTRTRESLIAQAPVFCHFLGRFEWNQERVCELGCGTGLVGIYLALRGADVLLTDLEFQLDVSACKTSF
jgi:hypothetical protein